jgi:septum formation protein
MHSQLILASASLIRAQMLRGAGLDLRVIPARIDEAKFRITPGSAALAPRDIASALAERKARHISEQHPDALVLGADQVLDLGGIMLSKPESPADAIAQLTGLSGRSHRLLSAVAVCQAGRLLWHHVGEARLTMHPLAATEIEAYVAAHWASIRHAVGCYKLEEHGARFFSAVEGDYFTVLGLPLIEFLTWLRDRGEFAS